MKNGIIITGGELFNKGAQSMTFNVVNRLKMMYPSSTIYLMSADYYRNEQERNKYNFKFLPPTTKVIFNLNYGKNMFSERKTNEEMKILQRALKDSYLNIDLSGLKLSSQMGWQSSLAFLLERKLMDKYEIQQVIFPQSFGPFNYKMPWKILIDVFAKKYLKKPATIYCRENQAYDNIQKYTKSNIKRSYDSVFYSKPYNYNNIFKGEIDLAEFSINESSVGVIPNKMLLKYNSIEDLAQKYKSIIEEILRRDNYVYIFRHSIEDKDLCIEIKNLFKNSNKVIFLDSDYNCIELQELISNFKYIVGSRYHSIVHAFERKTPALILGWAYKYQELADAFEQNELVFDIRNEIDIRQLQKAIVTLEDDNEKLVNQIQKALLRIKENDIFEESILPIQATRS